MDATQQYKGRWSFIVLLARPVGRRIDLALNGLVFAAEQLGLPIQLEQLEVQRCSDCNCIIEGLFTVELTDHSYDEYLRLFPFVSRAFATCLNTCSVCPEAESPIKTEPCSACGNLVEPDADSGEQPKALSERKPEIGEHSAAVLLFDVVENRIETG